MSVVPNFLLCSTLSAFHSLEMLSLSRAMACDKNFSQFVTFRNVTEFEVGRFGPHDETKAEGDTSTLGHSYHCDNGWHGKWRTRSLWKHTARLCICHKRVEMKT
jgi:hypothetical protein